MLHFLEYKKRDSQSLFNLPSDVLLSHLRTTIGARELNFCVRYGNRCGLSAIITRLVKFFNLMEVNLPKLDIFVCFLVKSSID